MGIYVKLSVIARPFLKAVDANGSQRADEAGNERGKHCDRDCHPKTLHDDGILEKLRIPIHRKTRPFAHGFAFVKGEHHEHENGQIEKENEQRQIEALKEFAQSYHNALLSPFLSYLRMMAMESTIKIIMMMASAEPVFQSFKSMNWFSNKSPNII